MEFFIVYIKEAHPSDGRVMPANTRAGISVKEPTSLPERQQVASKACQELKLGWPCLVDDMENSVNQAFAAWPTRLCVVDAAGKIAVLSRRGPAGLAPAVLEAEKWLKQFSSDSSAQERKASQQAPQR